jgi:dipeptidyl aminopeptidase/acylaminoacyl peptidase
MKKIALFLTIFSSLFLLANEDEIYVSEAKSWLTAGPIGLNLPAFYERPDLNSKTFSSHDFLDQVNIPATARISEGELLFRLFDKQYYWNITKSDENGSLYFSKQNKDIDELMVLANYLEIERFSKLNIAITSASPYQLYLNHVKIGGRNTAVDAADVKPENNEFKVEPDKHLLIIKVLLESGQSAEQVVGVQLSCDEKYNSLSWSQSPTQKKNMKHVLEGKRVADLSISADGKYTLVTYSEILAPEGEHKRWYEIMENQSGRIVHLINESGVSQLRFHPAKAAIGFVRSANNKKQLIQFDFLNQKERVLMECPEKFQAYHWLPDGEKIIYSASQQAEEKTTGLRKLEGMPDRLPNWRSRSQLYLMDVQTSFSQPLTHGYLSSHLSDISPDGNRALIVQTEPDFLNRPYLRLTLMELELHTSNIDTVFSTNYPASGSYSPDGKSLVVLGSPALFGSIGTTTAEDIIPNDTDTQGYIFNLSDKSVRAFTREFDPKILSARWSPHDGKIYLLTEDKLYQGIQVYDPVRNTFTKLPTQVDVVSSFSIAERAAALVYYGSSISAPDKAMLLNTKNMTNKTISDPEKSIFEDVIFGETTEWDFTASNGQEIQGHIYYPPGFDPARKYPLIVFYYAGINPINRSFRGRYPKNYFASLGYVVYTLTPSGSTGFGQEFAALHVNNWGMTVADEIIESTKGFLNAHPFIDRDAVGCIGASYGGFMTMLLLTRTDMFATAISHAGISSLSSYWGEGYWGYSYNAFAAANSFPWNRRDIYVEQSPLYHADKINTPLLLLHGNRDPNVPPGESIKMYTALKLLGKDVEYVEVFDQEHWILDYKKRLEWQKTIMSWFDKWLKKQPEWWDDLYPAKNL